MPLRFEGEQVMPAPRITVYYRSAVAGLYRRRRGLKLAALACSLALTLLFLVLRLGFGGVYREVIQEDGPLENAQAAAYLAAAVISCSVARSFARRRHALHALLSCALAVALTLVCLEEVSWGQRALGFPTPEYFRARNAQNELTLHNLDWLNTHLHRLYILFGLLCSFGWLFVRRRTGSWGRVGAAWLVPGWYLMFYFLPVAAVNSFFELCRRADALGVQAEYLRVGHFVVWRDQEPAELLLALGLLLFVVRNKLRQDSTSDGTL
jgi:hypothetical protein